MSRTDSAQACPGPVAKDAARRALAHAAAAVASAGTQDIFEVLVLGAAQALEVDLALIGVTAEGVDDHIATMAVCDRGQRVPNFVYALKGTPCEHVIGQRFRYHARGVQDLFPDPHVREVGAEGYAAIPLYDSVGSPMGLMAVVHRQPLRDRELTECILQIFSVRASVELERRRADEARRCSEESYRSIFEAAEDPLFIHDADTGAILDVNPKACEVYGYGRGELLALNVGDLSSGAPPYTLEHAAALIERARREGPVHMEWHRRNKDGSLHWDEVYIKLVKIGGADRILAVTREITDRKEREEALRKSEDRLRATVESALDCIIAIDEQGRIIEFNPAAEATFGHHRSEVLGLGLADLVVPERHRAAHGAGMDRYLSTGEGPYIGQRVEVSALRADGSEFPVELAIDVAQGPEGRIFIGYLRDITERKRAEADRARLEAQLRQAQKMEAIGQLTGGIAHDFNNILTGTLGYLTMAQEQAARYGDARLTRYLERAERSGQRAKGLIQEMLTFSRGQRGTPRSLQLGPHLSEAVKLLQSTLRLWLPAWFPAATAESEACQLRADTHEPDVQVQTLKGRVLLAEDEASVRELMQDLLTGLGLGVVATSDGAEACERLAADPDGFDLVLLDQTMPRMTGLEAAEQLRRLRPAVPIILYTGYSEHVTEAQLSSAGILHLVKKPLDVPAFRLLLRSVLGDPAAAGRRLAVLQPPPGL